MSRTVPAFPVLSAVPKDREMDVSIPECRPQRYSAAAYSSQKSHWAAR